MDDGVGVMGGAGSAHRSLVVVDVVGVRSIRIAEGEGVGVGAASAHSSLEVLVPCVIVGALRSAAGVVGVVTLEFVTAFGVAGVDGMRLGDGVVDDVVSSGGDGVGDLVAGMVMVVVGVLL